MEPDEHRAKAASLSTHAPAAEWGRFLLRRIQHSLFHARPVSLCPLEPTDPGMDGPGWPSLAEKPGGGNFPSAGTPPAGLCLSNPDRGWWNAQPWQNHHVPASQYRTRFLEFLF